MVCREVALEHLEITAAIEAEDVVREYRSVGRDRRFRLYWFGWSLPDRRKRLMHVADKRR
jgi:hypothetical protein